MAYLSLSRRYYGVNDPVANKMMARASTLAKLEPPADTSITTLYVGGLTPEITEADIQDAFYAHGEIKAVKKVRCQMFEVCSVLLARC